MTTIILTAIGILLAAASALMIAWYGGGAFNQGRINAEASRLIVEGSQIERAVGLYRAHEGRSPDVANPDDPLSALIDRRYMTKRPLGDGGRWLVDYQNGMIRSDVGAADDVRALSICRAARRQQNLPDPNSVFRCDGSDYPYSHPAMTLPANEPCCSWNGSSGDASNPSPTPDPSPSPAPTPAPGPNPPPLDM